MSTQDTIGTCPLCSLPRDAEQQLAALRWLIEHEAMPYLHSGGMGVLLDGENGMEDITAKVPPGVMAVINRIGLAQNAITKTKGEK